MKVLNKHRDRVPDDAIYIGRGSCWGNPFIIGRDGTREEVVYQYYRWIIDQPKLMARLCELDGHDLVCFCSPLLCHGLVLMFLVDACVAQEEEPLTLNREDGASSAPARTILPKEET